MIKGRKLFSVLAILMIFLISACSTRYHYEGAGIGGAIGGIGGALLDSKNPWRGGLIGAALGAIAGATITDISIRGSQEAARGNRPVVYKTEDGRGIYHAEPVSDYYRPDEQTKCRKVRERVWENDRIVKDTVKEVCEGEKFERKY